MPGIPVDPTDPTTQTSGKPPRPQDEIAILRDLQNRIAALERGLAQAEGIAFISPDGKTTRTISLDNNGDFIGLASIWGAGAIVQASIVTINTSGTGWESFAIGFPNTFPNILASCIYSLETSAFAGLGNVQSEMRSPTKTGFTIDIYTTVAITTWVHWLAVGA